MKRIVYLDVIRAWAIVSVVMLHVASPLIIDLHTPAFAWWSANFYYTLTRPCVPLFVMVSGALLLRSDGPVRISEFLVRRVLRVLLPFLFWAVIYEVWIALVNERPLSLAGAFRDIVQGPIYTPFWFVYMILGLYLATPLLAIIARHGTRRELLYFLALWFVQESIRQFVLEITGVSIGLVPAVATGFTGYFLLGRLLDRENFPPEKRSVLWGLAIAGALVTGFGPFFMSHGVGKLNEALYSFAAPNLVCFSAGVFVLLQSLPTPATEGPPPFFLKVARLVSDTSFSIFFLHVIVMETLRYGSLGVKLNANVLPPLLGVPLTTVVICAICITIALVGRKFPAGKLLFP